MLSWTQLLDILKLPEPLQFPTSISETARVFLKIQNVLVSSMTYLTKYLLAIAQTARTEGGLQTLKSTHRWGWMQSPNAHHGGDASCLQSALGITLCWLNKVGKQRFYVQTDHELSSMQPQTVNLHSLCTCSSETCSIQDSLEKTTTLAFSGLIIRKTVWGFLCQ